MILPLEAWHREGIRISVPNGNDDPIADALSATEERVALDIRVGGQYEHEGQSIAMPAELTLRPGDCIRILVKERLVTPANVFGAVCSRASLSSEGLFVANLKIDPKFSGHLHLAVLNGSRETIRIKPDDPFACIWFAKLTHPLPDAPIRFPTETKPIIKRSVGARLQVARPHLITGAVTLSIAVIAAVITHLLGVT